MTMLTDRTRVRPLRAAAYRRICLVCSMEYNYTPAGKDKGHEHKRGLFCSWACKSKHIKDNKLGPFSKLYTGYCLACTAPFVSKGRKIYCSSRCHPSSAAAPAMDRVCKLCGTQYVAANTGGKHKQYCSEQCKHIVDGGSRRKTKAARKARLRGATVEGVDPYVVFERDGWRCQMCGVETPASQRGTYELNAPELDHVVPLAKGGAHSYDNTQCACRRCNQNKGDKIVQRRHYFDETFYI